MRRLLRAARRPSGRTAGVLRVAAALTALGAACGGGGGGGGAYTGQISCTQTENVAGFGLLEACEEAPASARSQFQQGCTTTDGGSPTVMNAPCSRVDTLGGCEITSGGFKESFWYYGSGADADVGATPADIQRLCSASGGTYLAP